MLAQREFFGGSTRVDGLRERWKDGGETAIDCVEVDRAVPYCSDGQQFTSPVAAWTRVRGFLAGGRGKTQ